MPLVVTDAIVLHAFDYAESSRILRLATRDVGLQSVLARGARRSKRRFGSALDLFAQGDAELQLKDGRDLQTLREFDVRRARPALGDDLGRFAAASALAELVLRFGTADDSHPALFDTLAESFDGIAESPAERASEAGLAGAWRLVSELGFAPSVDACSACHATVADAAELPFSHSAGGVLCDSCARLHPGGRSLPAHARASIAAWSGARRVPALEPRAARAHQRLLREFLQQHLADGRHLRAFDVWERGAWGSP